jgi:uncharacterized membrane protein (DUF2068 family)
VAWSQAYPSEVDGKKKRPDNRYELFTCAWKGHALVGVDAAEVTDDDALVARERDGVRWYRCLRCDAWLPMPLPETPTSDTVPTRQSIELPARGSALRDRYVLRLIALDRAIHVFVLTILAVVLFTFAKHDASLHRDYINIMNDLNGGSPGESQVRGVLGYLRKAFTYSPHRLIQLGLLVTAYAALEATEMVGLWLAKRWAEYLTLLATTLLIPFEVYELTLKVSAFKVITLVINVAIVIYLLLAKRLFGLRGGHRAEMERRHEEAGWGAIERTTPMATESLRAATAVGEPVGHLPG